jgi:miniconductance mechanosensitive channel
MLQEINNFYIFLDSSLPPMILVLLFFFFVFVASLVVYVIIKRWLIALIHKLLKHTDQTWDDAIIETGLLKSFAKLAPPLVLFYSISYAPYLSDDTGQLIGNIFLSIFVIYLGLAISNFLNTFHIAYNQYPIAKDRPIKSFIQIIKIVLFLIVVIILISLIINKSPVLLLSGLGALTAVILLIFRDTLLSLVASIQITSLGLVKVGDWIEMPSCNADGDVIDVQLHTVKVQNWDKTISTIPTHKLISDSFKNWRGMSDSGTRRIKRSILIDLNSIKFLEHQELEKYRTFALLTEYINSKEKELKAFNEKIGSTSNVNLRRLTNIGTFRAYVFNYLKNHDDISQDSTLLVRQLKPEGKGLPIEIYVFTSTTNWTEYENIQSDIFDHLLATARYFDLRLFQEPTGKDFQKLQSN